MARIPESEIERLKLQVSMVRLVEAAGIALKPHGKDQVGRCVWHDDKTPSLVVSPKTNLWHCLGACQMGGGPIDWVMKFEGVSFRQAVEVLRRHLDGGFYADGRAGSGTTEGFVPTGIAPARSAAPLPGLPQEEDATRSRHGPAKNFVRLVQADATLIAAHEGDQALLNQVVGFYHATLRQSPEALAYLAKRGLDHAEVIDHFQLGFANRTLGYQLPVMQVKAGAEVRGALQRIGLYRGSGHEHFNGSVVVPVRDLDGNVTEVYGRKITPKLRPGTPLHLYLPGPHRGVFNAQGLVGQEEVILCEALIDALTFWCAGYRNVTASYGIEGFTADLLEAFKRHAIKRVLIAYDRDAAGNAAADKLAVKLRAEGLACYRILFPLGMDANEYALAQKPASTSLGALIRSAEWIGNGAAPLRAESLHVLPDATRTDASAVTDAPLAPVPLLAAAVPAPVAAQAAPPHNTTAPLPAPAAVLPPMPTAPALVVSEREVVLVLGDRRYRVRGLDKNLAYDVIKVNVLVSRDALMHVDSFDLYQVKARALFVRLAALELGVAESVIHHDLGQLLLALEAQQEVLIEARLRQSEAPRGVAIPAPLNSEDEAAAMDLLRDPNLIERIMADVEATGVVGEASNALVAYLACVSRKLKKPLAILIQSTSAAGKSTLMDALLALMPESERVQYSAMTGQSLFYLGEHSMQHKILAIAEEEGVRQAAYALKLLQSQGELTMASTGKDPATGQLVTQEYRVEGPVMLFLTTTAIDIDEELLNRCLVLTINESREQTAAIQAKQRSSRTLAGLLTQARSDAILATHRAAQQLLQPLAVVNPYAEQLTFASDRVRLRRDHQKYLALIDSIALLHQHQRPIQNMMYGGKEIAYIEVTLDDIALANRLAHEVLGRSLDELPPQTRRLLGQVQQCVAARAKEQAIEGSSVRVSRRDIRALAGLSETAVRIHTDRLVALEYLLPHAGRNGQRFSYELAFDGDVGCDTPHVVGLFDVQAMGMTATSQGQNATSQGQNPNLAAPSQAARSDLAAPSQGLEIFHHPRPDAPASSLVAAVALNALIENEKTAAHRNRNHANGAAAP